MTRLSRVSRWQGDDGRVNGAQRNSGLEESLRVRAQAVVEVAMIASRSARHRLERKRLRFNVQVCTFTTIAVVGVAGLPAVLRAPFLASDLTYVLAGLCAFAVAAAAVVLARLASTVHESEDSITSMLADHMAISKEGQHLARMADAITTSSDRKAVAVLEHLIIDVERRAKIVREQETEVGGMAAALLRPRRHERIVPRQTRTTLLTTDGRRLNALIIDVSRSGVGLEGNYPGCSVDQQVTVGSHAARVVRVLPRTLACEFAQVLSASELTPDIVL